MSYIGKKVIKYSKSVNFIFNKKSIIVNGLLGSIELKVNNNLYLNINKKKNTILIYTNNDYKN